MRRPLETRRARGALVLAGILAAAGLAGCLDDPAPSAVPTRAPSPEPTAVTTNYDLGLTAWYEGLLLHFDRASATLSAAGGPVRVSLRLENPGDDPGELHAPIVLVIGDSRVEPTRASRIPIVPAHGVAGVVLTFELQAIGSADLAIVEVGDPLQHRVSIPLTGGAGDPVLLEPRTFELSGTGNAGDLRITLRSAELRWDLPDWREEEPAGIVALTVIYDVTYTGGFAGGFAFTGENVALRLPDGSVIGARRDGHSQSVELLGAGKTKKALLSRFEIPTGTTGELELLVRNGSNERAIPFTLQG